MSHGIPMTGQPYPWPYPWPVPNRGAAPPSGAGSIVAGPAEFVLGGSPTAWSAGGAGVQGVLGESPIAALGVYDRRPWEGKPSSAIARQWYQAARPVGDWAQARAHNLQAIPLALRIALADLGAPNTLGGDTAAGLTSPFRTSGLTVLIAGWDTLSGQLSPRAGNDPTDQTAVPLSEPLKRAVVGPNVMPELMQYGVAEVDLAEWAGGTRFVAAWLWSYWTTVALITETLTRWTVLARPASRPIHPVTVSLPLRTIPDGPDAGTPSDANAIWRIGPPPDRGGAVYRRVGIVNGNFAGQTWYVRYYVGPTGTYAGFGGRTDVRAVGAGANAIIIPPAGDADALTAYSHVGIYGAQTAANGVPGGPAILSIVGGG